MVPTITENHLPETQCGLTANRGTTDMVALRQLQEKCREQNKRLYVAFMDLTNAFDSVSRKGYWMIMKHLVYPPKFLSMVIQLHKDQRGQVRLNHLDSSLFNLRRLHAHTITLEQLFSARLFTDYAALIAHTKRALQHLTSCFAEVAQLFRLKVSLKRTEVLHQPTPLEEYRSPHITIGGTELKAVHQFTYLGCTIKSDTTINKEVDNRLAKANSTFCRFYKRVWNSKISIYQAIILTTLLYGSVSWITYCHHLRHLERFHQCCLHTILNIHWSNYVSNGEVLDQAKITSLEAILLKSQQWCAGHVSRLRGWASLTQDSPVW